MSAYFSSFHLTRLQKFDERNIMCQELQCTENLHFPFNFFYSWHCTVHISFPRLTCLSFSTHHSFIYFMHLAHSTFCKCLYILGIEPMTSAMPVTFSILSYRSLSFFLHVPLNHVSAPCSLWLQPVSYPPSSNQTQTANHRSRYPGPQVF